MRVTIAISALALSLPAAGCRRSTPTTTPAVPADAAAAAPKTVEVAAEAPPSKPAQSEPAPVPPTAALPPPVEVHVHALDYGSLKPPREPPPIEVRDGRVLYMNQCAACHGEDGRALSRHPIRGIPNLSAGAVQDKLTDPMIARAVSKGHAGSPPYEKLLDAEQIQSIADFIRTLKL